VVDDGDDEDDGAREREKQRQVKSRSGISRRSSRNSSGRTSTVREGSSKTNS
jgi:hypothetical protein